MMSRGVIFTFKFRAATVHIPKPPANISDKAVTLRKEKRKVKEAQVSRSLSDVTMTTDTYIGCSKG